MNLTGGRPLRIGTKHETGTDLRKETVLVGRLVNSPAENWAETVLDWDRKYVFSEIPVVEVTVETRYTGKLGGVVNRKLELLSIGRSIVPSNAKWVHCEHIGVSFTLQIPGHWTGTRWAFDHHACWLATMDGGFPFIFEQRRLWYWPFGHKQKVQIVDLNKEREGKRLSKNFGLDLYLTALPAAMTKWDHKPIIGLVAFSNPIITTEKYELTTLFGIYRNERDSDGASLRDRVFANGLSIARSELLALSGEREHFSDKYRNLMELYRSTINNLASATGERNKTYESLRARDLWITEFVSELVRRLDATKKISTRKEFGEIRRFVERGAIDYRAMMLAPEKSGPPEGSGGEVPAGSVCGLRGARHGMGD